MSEEQVHPSPSWADPGYFTRQSPVGNLFRLAKQLVIRPRGHKTLPTRSGVVLILLALGIGTAAYNTASNILFLALALLLASLLLSGLLSWMNFKGTRWRILLEPHFRAGEPTPVRIELSNDKRWLPTYGLWFDLLAEESGVGAKIPLGDRVDPAGSVTLQWLLTPPRRGRERVRLRGLRSIYPFGFLNKSISDSYVADRLVWPARLPYVFKPPSHGRARREGRTAHLGGAGSDLRNLRDYQPGDPPRRVHWKASARLGKLLVREMTEENRESFHLAIDTLRPEWEEGPQLEMLCRFASSLAEDLFKRDQLGGVMINRQEFHPIRQLADLHRFLDDLACLQTVEHLGRREAPRGSIPVTFRPGHGDRVNAWIYGEIAGTA